MSAVPWNVAVAPVCALLGGTGLARVPAPRPVALPMLLRPRPRTPVKMACEVAARVPREKVCWP
jgi:hypothetical protein